MNNEYIEQEAVEMTESETQQMVAEIYNYAIDLMVIQEKTADETRQMLVERGLCDDDAAVVVANVDAEIRKAQSGNATKNMFWGAVWCIGGIVVTAATYSAASDGGTFIIAWGAIIFGAIQFFKGLANK